MQKDKPMKVKPHSTTAATRVWQLSRLPVLFLLLLNGCGGGSAGGDPPPPTCANGSLPSASVDCAASGTCPIISVSGDAPATTPGLFKGYADPAITGDPDVPGRFWLSYSWPHIAPGQAPDGTTVNMVAVSIHLSRSDDFGNSFVYVGELWTKVPAADPEGSGQNGILSSEVSSLASMRSGSITTWYGSRQRYFLQPQTGYYPKYSTSWTMTIAAATSPEGLASASQTVLGVSTTAAQYGASVHIDELAGLPITRCALLNNPALFTSAGTLYVIVECLAFVGTQQDYVNNTIQVFATQPSGAPSGWSWRHAGMLADGALAAELGSPWIKQPSVSRADDGTPLLFVTSGVLDPLVTDGVRGTGCLALELESIDPPVVRRDCAGRPVVRTAIQGTDRGACTHHAGSATGVVVTSSAATGGFWALQRSGVQP
jgi:hypothetical protein